MTTSKREQIRQLIREGRIKNRAEIARLVGANYQTVRNVEIMMHHEGVEIFIQDPVSSDVTDCTVCSVKFDVLLWEERPIKYKDE